MRFSHLSGITWAVLVTSVTCKSPQTTYDYIVVGGGPAGLITAQRLTEANKKVLLLERGHGPTVSTGSNHTLTWNNSMTPIDVPGLSSAVGGLDLWNEYMCDDTAGLAACVLGGGTTINFMVFVHPPERDFDDKWPRGWKWEDVAPAADRLYARNSGTLTPSKDGERYDVGLYKTLSGFFDKLGWKSVDMIKQPNEKHQVYSWPSWNVKDALRAGPVKTYLPLAQTRDNFTLRQGTKVIRVVRAGSRATGVEVETSNGEKEIVQLAKGGRVVLSAGALSTPRLLFNSGIGPKKQILTAQKAGVALPAQRNWIELPVGENLLDHPIFSFTVKTGGAYNMLDTDSVLNGSDTQNIDLYEKKGSGILTQGRHRLIFFSCQKGSDGVARYFQGSCAASGEGAVSIKVYMTHGLTSSGVLGMDEDGKTVFEQSPYLQTNEDTETAKVFVQQIVDSISDSSTGFELQDFTNTSAIIDSVTNGNHYAGTAKMGTDDGRKGGSSVVDTNTKVYGMDNLFISDASIHPDLSTGNLQTIVMVAAEAAAAKILCLCMSTRSRCHSPPSRTRLGTNPALHITSTLSRPGDELGSFLACFQSLPTSSHSSVDMVKQHPITGSNASQRQPGKDDGTWLCADGPYLDYIKSSCPLQPNLRLPDFRNRAVPLRNRSAHATLLSFDDNWCPSRTDFTGPESLKKLQDHFSKLVRRRQGMTAGEGLRHVYLLEGLNSDVVSIFGQELHIDPTFFANHERTSTYLRLPYEPSLALRLPSVVDSAQMFTATYYDIRTPNRPFESFSVACASSGRDVLTSRLSRNWEQAVILHQKCSIWKTTFNNRDDWSVLILCDPPFNKAHIWSQPSGSEAWKIESVDVTTTPFQGGYADFVPTPFGPEAVRAGGPVRQGLHDDLCYYLMERLQNLPKKPKPTFDATLFPRKIIASHYLHLIEYNDATLSSMEFTLQRKDDFSAIDVASLEGRWSDIQLICSRCNRYIKDVSFIMLQLGISFEEPGASGFESTRVWTESHLDFQYIHMQLKVLKGRAEFLNESLTGLTGIIGNTRSLKEAKRSIREAKTVKTLTLVAMVFIPLSFTTSLFSMYDDYLPGRRHFGIFFAVSVPLIIFVFAAAFVVDLGYDINGNWNFGTMLALKRVRRGQDG
ncbi:hypothetical protein NM208_g406 [Fusarium decemcellulare]|uniref:Uncharacterized protein n=1 Tax=Fusarium decemcellulare TaxID=57161 RepID=A0ACC1SZT7_9HYPO|nr:hypothetical protein NM208_g406 [Fusarium decemcellulare]